MFDDEEEDFYGDDVNEDLKLFNEMYDKNSYQFLDADRIEGIIDHLLVTSQYKKARWAAEQALAHFPFNNLFMLRKAQAMSLSGELKEAIRILTYLERIDNGSLDILLTIASCFSQLRDSDSAIKYFKKAIQFADGEDRADIYIDLAMEYENQNDYRAAIDTLNKGILEDPKNESVVYELAYCYDQVNEYDNSIKCFLNYIDEDPYSYTAWYNLANAYAKIDNLEKAIWAYDYCILVNEDFSPAYFNLANTYMEQDDFVTALEFYNKCLEIDGDDGMVYCSIGECYEELLELEKAYDAYVKSTDFLPQLADAWLGRGIVSDLMGDTATAISEINVAISLEPESASFYQALGDVYINDEQHDLGVENYEKALKLSDQDFDLIIDYLKNLIEIDPALALKRVYNDPVLKENNAAKIALVQVLWLLNRRTDSLILFDELIENDISNAKSLFLHFPNLNSISDFTDRLDD